MELYYTIHILVFLSCVFEFSRTTIKTKRKIILLWCVFFTLFGGLRWKIGGDWDQYYEHFLNSEWSNIFNYDRYGNGAETLEPGFVFINATIKYIFGQFYWYNLIIVGFIQYTYYKFSFEFSHKYPILMYALLMLLATAYFPVRAGLALGVVYWSYKYIRDRQLKKFLLIICCAGMIHNQCFVILPFYWAGHVKLNLISASIIYILFIIAAKIFQDYFIILSAIIGGDLGDKMLSYTNFETEGFKGASYLGWGLNYFFLFIYFYIRKKCNYKNNLWYNTLINIFITYNGLFIVFSNGMGDLTRLASAFFPAQAILFLFSMNYFLSSPNKNYAKLAILFYILYYSYKITSIGSGYFFESTCIPYKTIFDYNII